MLNTSNKIQKHKADIERRIQDLESKLKQPTPKPQSYAYEPEMDMPYRRVVAQQEQYVEPKAVTALRERESNLLRDSRHAYPTGKTEVLLGMSKRGSEFRETRSKVFESNASTLLDSSKTQQLVGSIRPVNKAEKDSEIYEMMSEILRNQRHLERQLGLLRSQFTREQATKPDNQTPYTKIAREDQKKQHIISFQEQEHDRKEQSKKDERSQIRDISFTRPQAPEDSRQNHPLHFVEEKSEHLQPKLLDRSRPKNRAQSSSKGRPRGRIEPSAAQLALYTLVQNQRARSDRLVVPEELKNELWRQVYERIKQSEHEYEETFHGNSKNEQEHLVGVGELQRKLRGELIAKVYAMCNNCVYK